MVKENQIVFPKIGDRLMRPISSTCSLRNCDKLEPCVVVYVSEPKYYYTVEFIDYGIKESFKVPYINEIEAFKKDYRRAFGHDAKGVYVYESGQVYPSIHECAKAIGTTASRISRHIHGNAKHVKGYHIYILD